MTMLPAPEAGTTVDHEMGAALRTAIPALRAFAASLTGDAGRGDDLVQATLVRAWTGADRLAHGPGLTARLFGNLRDLFYAERCRRRRAREDADDVPAAQLAALPDRAERIGSARFRAALDRLPDPQREALILVDAQCFTYAEAAAICGVAVGTVKSRVSRGRARLAEDLAMDAGSATDATIRTAPGSGRPPVPLGPGTA